MFCNQCGTKLKEGLKFCTNCGTRAADDGPQSPALQAVTSTTNPPSGASASMDDAHSGAAALGKSQPRTQSISPALLCAGIVFLVAAVLVTAFLIYHQSPSRPLLSDVEIEKALQAKFAADPDLGRLTLEVHSQAGVVTLIGLVNSDSDKSVATRIAEQQEGVKQVNVYGLAIRASGVSTQGEAAGTGGATSPEQGVGELAQPSSADAANGDIRNVDFRTFDYSSAYCGNENAKGPNGVIHVSQGEWKTGTPNEDEMRFDVVNVFYGDVMGDGRDEAVVHTSCGGMANFDDQELYIFAMSAGGPILLARLVPDDWGKGQEGNGSDYAISKIRVGGGYLAVSFYSGGSHACADWIVTARFAWNGSRFIRNGLTRARNQCQ